MFAGSVDGARRTATLYAVISTAVLCGVEPWAYVRDLLEKIISGFPQRRIDDLLPTRGDCSMPEARFRRDPAAASAA
jgi:transposase